MLAVIVLLVILVGAAAYSGYTVSNLTPEQRKSMGIAEPGEQQHP
jgi:hypothetical protein